MSVQDPRVLKILQLEDLIAHNPNRDAMPSHHRQALEALEKEVQSYGDPEELKANADETAREFAEFLAQKAAAAETAPVAAPVAAPKTKAPKKVAV